jgi:hypothetical protein
MTFREKTKAGLCWLLTPDGDESQETGTDPNNWNEEADMRTIVFHNICLGAVNTQYMYQIENTIFPSFEINSADATCEI